MKAINEEDLLNLGGVYSTAMRLTIKPPFRLLNCSLMTGMLTVYM